MIAWNTLPQFAARSAPVKQTIEQPAAKRKGVSPFLTT